MLLFSDELKVLISTKSLFAKKDKLALSDLKKMSLAFYSDENDKFSTAYQHYFNNNSCFRLNNKENIMQMVAENRAVALYPEKLTKFESYAKDNLVCCMSLEDFSFPVIDYIIFYPSKKTLSQAIKRVVDNIKENLCSNLQKQPTSVV
jgi:DNA-binding transcriptional LysR family regulator